MKSPRFLLVANTGCRRLELFRAALEKHGLGAPRVVSYAEILEGRVDLSAVVREGDVVRLESPGRDWEVEKAILQRGAPEAEEEEEGRFRALSSAQIEALEFDKGRLWPSRQWFLGLRALLGEIGVQLRASPPHRASHSPADILTFFDKPACHARLHHAQISVPPALPAPTDFEMLMQMLREVGWNRAFLKLAHGSSAAGVVAFQFGRSQVRAETTAEMIEIEGEIRLYNSRRLRVYRTWSEVARLVDALCRENLHVERWFPKASFRGQTCDARVVVIAGRMWSGVARLSAGPLTNLHLLNNRAPLDDLRAAMRPEAWEAARKACEKAMQLFPATLLGGVDLAFSPDFRRHAVLEINAWGDLLPGTTREGQDSYEAQIEALTRP